MIFFVYLLLCIFVLFSLILFQLLRHNYTIANRFEAIEAQSKIPLRWVFFTANIPQPDEIAKQNADVFPSYLAPLSNEEKIYERKTRTQAMIVDPRGFRPE